MEHAAALRAGAEDLDAPRLSARVPAEEAGAARRGATVRGNPEELEIRKPRPRKLDAAGALWLVPDETLASAFRKPIDPREFHAAFGAGAFELESRSEARKSLGQPRAEGLEVVLQEYSPSPPSAHGFVEGSRDREETIRARLA